MKGDFTRDSFDPRKGVYRLLMQQGRVQLDADWNEQVATVLHRLEAVVSDLFGPFSGPERDCGFEIRACDDEDVAFVIGAGRYYLDGVLAENYDDRAPYRRADDAPKAGCYLAYLDVWEEFVAPQQDIESLDPALGGLDTAARTRILWRVRLRPLDTIPSRESLHAGWSKFLEQIGGAPSEPRVGLAVTVGEREDGGDPALGTARSGYHGSENRLYRVEIHEPGKIGDGATFKWSRDNGAVAFAIRSIADRMVTLEAVGRDERADIVPGDWVEIVDDDDAGAATARALFAVAHADPAMRTVTLKTPPGYIVRRAKHPVLRRWDQRSAPITIPRDSDADPRWLPLEDGIAIRFVAPHGRNIAMRVGEYWTIPARTADGGIVLWERAGDEPLVRESQAIVHRYAPLAGIEIDGERKLVGSPTDYRRTFAPLGHATKETSQSQKSEEPLNALGIEAHHIVALKNAGISTVEHVAATPPDRLQEIVGVLRDMNPMELIARAKEILSRGHGRQTEADRGQKSTDWWRDP
ncbi:MAG: hypothetical protein NVS3B17_13560 [Vulcanimicrobiaceae bacterium]